MAALTQADYLLLLAILVLLVVAPIVFLRQLPRIGHLKDEYRANDNEASASGEDEPADADSDLGDTEGNRSITQIDVGNQKQTAEASPRFEVAESSVGPITFSPQVKQVQERGDFDTKILEITKRPNEGNTTIENRKRWLGNLVVKLLGNKTIANRIIGAIGTISVDSLVVVGVAFAYGQYVSLTQVTPIAQPTSALANLLTSSIVTITETLATISLILSLFLPLVVLLIAILCVWYFIEYRGKYCFNCETPFALVHEHLGKWDTEEDSYTDDSGQPQTVYYHSGRWLLTCSNCGADVIRDEHWST